MHIQDTIEFEDMLNDSTVYFYFKDKTKRLITGILFNYFQFSTDVLDVYAFVEI
jgi:hypothetical protein